MTVPADLGRDLHLRVIGGYQTVDRRAFGFSLTLRSAAPPDLEAGRYHAPGAVGIALVFNPRSGAERSEATIVVGRPTGANEYKKIRANLSYAWRRLTRIASLGEALRHLVYRSLPAQQAVSYAALFRRIKALVGLFSVRYLDERGTASISVVNPISQEAMRQVASDYVAIRPELDHAASGMHCRSPLEGRGLTG